MKLPITQQFEAAVENSWIYSRFGADVETTGRTLLVFVHGFGETADEYSSCLRTLLATAELDRYDLLPFTYADLRWTKKHRRHRSEQRRSRRYNWLSNLHPDEIARGIGNSIDAALGNGYRRVRIIAHSFGALLARAAILNAIDEPPEAGSQWVRHVDRLVLLAGTNRGFVPDRTTYRLLLLLPCWAKLAQHGLRGSEWVTSLRLRWLELARGEDSPLPKTIQVRGRADRIVGGDDSVEIYQYPESEQHEVEKITHMDFLHIGAPENRELLERVLAAIARQDGEPAPKLPVPDVEQVVFLIHGIRDFGDWQESVEFAIQQRILECTLADASGSGGAADGLFASRLARVKVISVRCGRFNALQFLSPGRRRWNVQSFADRYVQERCKAPNAEFSVAAHSLGTLVLGRALHRYPTVMAFKRVFLAGAVLPTGYPWSSFAIDRIHNVCGRKDGYVGGLCPVLRWFGYRHFGTAGLHGFEDSRVENEFHNGGHSDWLKPAHQKDIARFLVDPQVPLAAASERPGKAVDGFPGKAWLLLAPVAASALLSAMIIPAVPIQPECLGWAIGLAAIIGLLVLF